MDVMETIRRRRSCRNFLPKPVDEAIIGEMLEAAQLSPSGGNGQNHVFGIVREEAQKLALAKAAGNQMWIAKAPVVFACCARLETDLKDLPESDFGLAVNHMRFTKHFIDYLNNYPGRQAVGSLFVNAAPFIPTEHMVLAATAHGLAACMIGYLDVSEAGRVLGLPEDMVCLYLLPVGYPAKEPGKKKLKSVEEISFRERYGG